VGDLFPYTRPLWQPPNKRVKLPGAIAPKEAVRSCLGGLGTFVHYSCAAAGVARSLRAVR